MLFIFGSYAQFCITYVNNPMKNKRSLSIDLLAKIKTTLVLLCLFASICTYGQEEKDFGVGTFTLQYYYYPDGVFSNDSTKHILLKRIYHIKHSRVINKTIGPPEKIQKDTSEVISKSQEMEVKSKMEAKAIYPTYLADYKNKKYFMYFENTKKSYYYQDSLKNHPEDLYNSKVNNNKPIITNIKGGEITIAGKHCSTALAINGLDTIKFYYTKEKLRFISPLNIIPGVTDSVLGIQTIEKDGKAFGLFIINIKDEEQPDDTFTIPPTARLKTWSEVMHLGNTPN